MAASTWQESTEQKQRRALDICARLAAAYPESRCALCWKTPFQLLIATVLSAQTNDQAVNRVTRELFRRFPDAASMANAPESEIEACINSIGLWRNKAKFLRGISRILVERYGGEVPRDLKALMELPGVARKTATAVLGTAYGIAAGITVDTHMMRINRLLQLSDATSPDKMARDLETLLPKDEWNVYTHRIIDHGRLVCVARRPRCGVCPLADCCPSACDPDIGYDPRNDAREPASAKGLSWLQECD